VTRIHEADNFIGSLGFEAYRVGGSVRDEIMGRKPKDADYIVRGVPLPHLGQALLAAGAKVGRIVARDKATLGWRAHVEGVGLLEIVLPRVERNAGSGRKQEIEVDHRLPLGVDAKRRDFTFNALYKGVGEGYPESAAEGGVIDPTGSGLHDLQHRIIRVTHADSFRDDPLRTLRALRFVSTLDADLDPETRALMALHADEVTGLTDKGVSGTVLDEIKKLLMGQAPAKALRVARDTGVLAVAIPELAPMLGFDQGSRYHDLSTDEHTFKALDTAARVGAPLRVRMALLFHDAGKPEAAWVGLDGRKHYYAAKDGTSEDHEVVSERLWRSAASRLNVERKLRNDVSTLVLNHMVPSKTKNLGTRVRRMRVKFGDELLSDLFLHRCCDLSGKGVKVALNHIEHIQRMESTRAASQAAGFPASIKDLQVDGNDAKALGLTDKRIGEALAGVLDEVVCRPDAQTLSREWQFARLEARVNA
jgi:tRNA nucleotidyltransferase (CCA-adding enzyme)